MLDFKDFQDSHQKFNGTANSPIFNWEDLGTIG
jgi:hypothetical protein